MRVGVYRLRRSHEDYGFHEAEVAEQLRASNRAMHSQHLSMRKLFAGVEPWEAVLLEVVLFSAMYNEARSCGCGCLKASLFAL